MALIILTLFGACCTLSAVFAVILFDVSTLLVLQIYLGVCATLVFFGLILSLVLPHKALGRQTESRGNVALKVKRDQMGRDPGSSQAPLVPSARYTKLVRNYQHLEPIQTADVESDR
jgi:hypothetical protein